MNILSLPDEIIAEIVAFLHPRSAISLSHVCTRFNTIAKKQLSPFKIIKGIFPLIIMIKSRAKTSFKIIVTKDKKHLSFIIMRDSIFMWIDKNDNNVISHILSDGYDILTSPSNYKKIYEAMDMYCDIPSEQLMKIIHMMIRKESDF